MVASAALVRGERAGALYEPDPALRLFEVPAMVGAPDPACWAQHPEQPVGCAQLASDDTDDVLAATTSANYPPWSYVLPGLASFVPWAAGYAYLARMMMGLVPLALVTASILRSRSIGPGATSALLVGMTPIAWFSMSIVNPSAVAIAGGLALWVALLSAPDKRGDLLLVGGAAAVLLARRDGPVWVTLIVLAVCLALSQRPSNLLRDRRRWTWMTVGVLGAIPVISTFLAGFRDLNLVIAASPFGLIAVDLVVRRWTSVSSARSRVIIAGAAVGALSAVAVVAVAIRPGLVNRSLLLLIMSNTGTHLNQLVGVLGWLDTPVPAAAVFAFWGALGALAAIAFLEQPKIAFAGAFALAATIVTAWILELGQGATYGQYWQGRYSMPIVVGIPLLFAVRTNGRSLGGVSSSPLTARLARPLLVVIWFIANLGFAGALHRWGVGVGGSWAIQRWDTWAAPLAPWLLLAVHALATGALLASSDDPIRPAGRTAAMPSASREHAR
jgi:hypothetical protein